MIILIEKYFVRSKHEYAHFSSFCFINIYINIFTDFEIFSIVRHLFNLNYVTFMYHLHLHLQFIYK